ncbi:hypothetical protein BC833DRAFT_572736 [Globomyces pollinis-pini]|nr:hypothetical protein BC833DRAFT_572736 [Globomyces pollinis-pini]
MILDTSQSKPDQYSSHVVERNMSISTTTSLSCDGSDAFDIFDNQSKVDHPPKFREFITHPIRKLEGLYKMKRRITKKNTGKRINYSSTVRELLKDWLYTHQSDPYPTEDEKDHLCGLTKMSKVQLNNWFVNGRRRYLN